MPGLSHIDAALEIKAVLPEQRIIIGFAAYHSNRDRVQDIIDPTASVKAVGRLGGNFKQVGVFIGHKTDSLPMGVPLVIEPRPEGLYTETLIKPGPSGDDLLATAAFLQQHNSPLGMSIGYRTHDSKMERGTPGATRRILDYSLAEYSYAANQAIANESALVVGVKTDDDAAGVKTDDDDRASVAQKTEGPMTLPDSAYLYIQPGGQRDDDGNTVPRSHRHLAYKTVEGEIDVDALRAGLGTLTGPTFLDLDATQTGQLRARAQRLLSDAEAGRKTVAEAPEWQTGAPLTLWGVGYQLQELADAVAASHKALTLLGEDTKAGARMQAPLRATLRETMQTLKNVLDWAEMTEAGTDQAAKLAGYDRDIELLELVAAS